MIKKTLIRAVIGFFIGILMGNGIAFLTTFPAPDGFPVADLLTEKIGSPLQAFIVQTLVSGLFGAVCFGGVSLHDCDRLPLAVSCLSHCLLMVLSYIPVSVFLCWTNSLEELLFMAGIQIVVYFIIWLIMYSLYKKEIRELNSMQEHYLRRKTTEKKEETT